MSLEPIVRTYKLKIRPHAQSELEWFRKRPSLASAVEYAAMAINSKDKRYSHQRRLKKSNLEEVKGLLLKDLDSIKGCRSFDELFMFIERIALPIYGIGELYVYDTALRIGANLDLLPTKVYLHAGTRMGAKALGFKGKEKSIEVSEFPNALQQLEAYEIEDVLCIFEDELSKVGSLAFSKDMGKKSWCC